MYSASEILKILPQIHIPKNKIWCYSGFKIEEIQSNPNMKKLLDKCNVLVDGQFEIDKRIVNAGFYGSSNQRIWKRNDKGEWHL